MHKLKLQLKNKYLPKWSFWLFIIICLMLIVYVDSLGVGFLGKFFDKFSFWDFLNKNSGAVQALSTVVLILITGFYAFQTRETNQLISMQVFPNISIRPDKLYSSLLKSEFVTAVKEHISKPDNRKNYNFRFKLDYSVSNHSASSGSIERPQLLIENPQSRKKKYLLPDTRDVVIDTSCKGEIKNTIYLRAGEVKNIEEEFNFFVSCDKPLTEDDRDLIDNASSLKYTILYKNVAGNQFSITITKENILPLT